eukprot:scaffold256434_cov19-Tisochrysis_lutea.AAC.1
MRNWNKKGMQRRGEDNEAAPAHKGNWFQASKEPTIEADAHARSRQPWEGYAGHLQVMQHVSGGHMRAAFTPEKRAVPGASNHDCVLAILQRGIKNAGYE